MNPESGKTAGRALKRIFKQDDILSKIEEQPASFSLLMNHTRMKIFIHLCQSPCDHTRSIARAIETSLTTVNWHLGQLLENEYLEAKAVHGKKVYWPAGMLISKDAELVNCIRQDIVLAILRYLSQTGDTRQKEIVKKMNMKQQNIDFWLKKMISCGILKRKGKGIGTTYHVSKNLADKVAEHDSKARTFSRIVFDLFYYDGLMPSNSRFKGSRVGIDVKLPSGKKRIHLECNPLAVARQFMTASHSARRYMK